MSERTTRFAAEKLWFSCKKLIVLQISLIEIFILLFFRLKPEQPLLVKMPTEEVLEIGNPPAGQAGWKKQIANCSTN
jgi:hypothetical protein